MNLLGKIAMISIAMTLGWLSLFMLDSASLQIVSDTADFFTVVALLVALTFLGVIALIVSAFMVGDK